MTNLAQHYDVERVIGKGSYGEVHLVRHKRDKKTYVAKKIGLQKVSKKERRAAEQEAQLLKSLKHPNIVSYKDSFESPDGHLYIIMAFCDGGDLYTALKNRKGAFLDEQQVVEWFMQIAMAIQYLHERKILHRDLKTQNIFLTKTQIVKVGDLGIARVLESATDMATTLIGTPYYMSPELFSNKPYDFKSDVWALGCCVYEMATLKHAFNAKDLNSLAYKIIKGRMPQMPSQYSTEFVTIIKSMLNHDPKKRPTVSRVLRDPFIRKHMVMYLEKTRRAPAPERPNSGRKSSASSSNSASAISNESRGSKPSTPVDKFLLRNDGEYPASKAAVKSVPKKPVQNERPSSFPPPPIASEKAPTQDNRRPMAPPRSMPSSAELPASQLTPRSRPNSAARERRREKLLRESNETPRDIHVSKSEPTFQNPRRANQPGTESSGSSEEADDVTTEQRQEKDRLKGEREVDRMIIAMDTTLKMAPKPEEDDDDDVVVVEEPSNPVSHDMAPEELPFGAGTLNSTARLVKRLQDLQKDCVQGVGVKLLQEAFNLLDNVEDAKEERLLQLLGADKFDQFAGKIWQLKFYNDSLWK